MIWLGVAHASPQTLPRATSHAAERLQNICKPWWGEHFYLLPQLPTSSTHPWDSQPSQPGRPRLCWRRYAVRSTRDVKTRTGGDRQSFARDAVTAFQIKIFGLEPKQVIIPSPPLLFFFSLPDHLVFSMVLPAEGQIVFGERGTKASQPSLCKMGQERGKRCLNPGVGCARWESTTHPPPPTAQHPLPRQAKAVWKPAKLIQQTTACRDGRRMWAL